MDDGLTVGPSATGAFVTRRLAAGATELPAISRGGPGSAKKAIFLEGVRQYAPNKQKGRGRRFLQVRIRRGRVRDSDSETREVGG